MKPCSVGSILNFCWERLRGHQHFVNCCIFTCIYFIPSTIGSHSLYVMCCSSATTTLLIVRICVAILKGCLTLPPGKVAHRPSLVESLTVLLPPCCVLSSTPWVYWVLLGLCESKSSWVIYLESFKALLSPYAALSTLIAHCISSHQLRSSTCELYSVKKIMTLGLVLYHTWRYIYALNGQTGTKWVIMAHQIA